MLEPSMILGTGCLAEGSLDGGTILDVLGRTGLQTVLLAARKGARAADLRGVPAVGAMAAWDLRGDAVAAARAAGTDRLILDLPEEMELDAACRSLFALAREAPGLTLALQTPAAGPLAEPESLGLVLEDLSSLPINYWHRPSRAHLLGVGDTVWVDRLGNHLRGLFLDDVRDGEAGLPPGIGELDLATAAELSARSIDVVLDIDPVPDVSFLRVALDTLNRLGFS
jgi:hypothetical protein